MNIRSGPSITDVVGELASRTQLARLTIRYRWARDYCHRKSVLEVACGTGQGLELLSSVAQRVVGGDYSAENLCTARATYGSRVNLVRFDAQALPVGPAAVDVVLLLEALYFLPSPDAFLREACRVLRAKGLLLLSVINKDCRDYSPSNLYYHSYGAVELARLLQRYGFTPQCFGAIPLDRQSMRERLVRPLKHVARYLNLIPTTMQSRLLVKRLAFGRLSPIPRVLPADSWGYEAPVAIRHDNPDTTHQVLLCAARVE